MGANGAPSRIPLRPVNLHEISTPPERSEGAFSCHCRRRTCLKASPSAFASALEVVEAAVAADHEHVGIGD